MIANAVNCEDGAIRRRAATDLDPDSDLGRQLVTVGVGPLPLSQGDRAPLLGSQPMRQRIYKAGTDPRRGP